MITGASGTTTSRGVVVSRPAFGACAGLVLAWGFMAWTAGADNPAPATGHQLEEQLLEVARLRSKNQFDEMIPLAQGLFEQCGDFYEMSRFAALMLRIAHDHKKQFDKSRAALKAFRDRFKDDERPLVSVGGEERRFAAEALYLNHMAAVIRRLL